MENDSDKLIINGNHIYFSYDRDQEALPALRDIGLAVSKGELVVILGQNGCGKSTLLKHLNALLPLQSGTLTVNGIHVANEADIWQLRRQCGMVFQNPDNQFVSSIIEEDIAFGLENYQVPPQEIAQKVQAALSLVGMDGYEKRTPHSLSGGQKQRIALAGVLALEPDILLFDEVTAMLDPQGRSDLLALIHRLCHDSGKTIVMITHYVEEAVWADRVYLMQNGAFLASGTPQEILTNLPLLAQANILPPLPVRLYYDLIESGLSFPSPSCPLTKEGLVEVLCQLQ